MRIIEGESVGVIHGLPTVMYRRLVVGGTCCVVTVRVYPFITEGQTETVC